MNIINFLPMIIVLGIPIALLCWTGSRSRQKKLVEPPKITGQIVIKTYSGNQAKATALYQADVPLMAAQGYFPTSQSWVPGTRSGSDFIVALLLCIFIIGLVIFLYMLLVPADGTLSVTYELRAPAANPVEEKTCPKCAEQIKAAALVCRYCGYELSKVKA